MPRISRVRRTARRRRGTGWFVGSGVVIAFTPPGSGRRPVGGRCGRTAHQVAGEGRGGPADHRDDERRDHEVDDVVAEAVTDRAAGREAAVLIGWAAAAEDRDRDRGVQQLQRPAVDARLPGRLQQATVGQPDVHD
jgi:hypothetical protein